MNRYRCDLCPLAGRPVEPSGRPLSAIWIIGEAPGADEDAMGRPFVGQSGQELTMYLRRFARINRDICYITNLVQCRPPANRDPKAEEINNCTEAFLTPTLKSYSSKTICTVGRLATQWFLGHVNMSKVHGIPHHAKGHVIVPAYHPAYGMRSTIYMQHIINDFRALGDVVRGNRRPVDTSSETLDYKGVD